MGGSPDRFPTGMRFLDQQLGGGLVPGGILALLSPPNSQVELLFRELAAERRLVYVSVLSPDEAELRRIIDPDGDRSDSVEVAYRDPAALLSDPEGFLEGLPEGTYVILDSVNELERAATEEYLPFLNALKRRMRTAGGFAIVHCLKEESAPGNRTLTLKRADHVWDLRVSIGDEIATELCITKSRENQILPEPLPLELTDEVRIDTSRTIA